MTDFFIGGASVIGGIYLMESLGSDIALMNIPAGGLILFGLYRLVMMLVEMGD